MLSVVIPVLRLADLEPARLAEFVDAADEVVVVAAAGPDASPVPAGVRAVRAARGRGQQLAAGAAAAGGEWLLFLHADTRLAPGWTAAVAAFRQRPGNSRRAAYFRLAFDDGSPAARRTARIANWRARRFGLPYGDQGLLIGRALYAELGGYRPIPLMEDVDLVRRIGRDRLSALPVAAVTSAAKYRREGWTRRSCRNLACLALYVLGVPPRWIVRLYG